MIQVLPSAKNLGDFIGQGLSQGVKEGMKEDTMYQRNRGRLQEGFDEVKKGIKDGGSNLDITLNAAKAFAGIPGSERYFDKILPTILDQANQERAPNALRGGAEALRGQNGQTMPEVPTNETSKPIKQTPEMRDVENKSNEFLVELRPDLIQESSNFARVPSFDFDKRSTLRPDEEANIRERLNADKVPLSQQNQILERLNNDIKSRYQEAQNIYQYDKDAQAAIANKWQTVSNAAPAKVEPFLFQYPQGEYPGTRNEIMNNYYKYAEAQPVNLTPEQIHTNAMTDLQKDLNQLSAIKALPEMPFLRTEGDSKKYFNHIKEAYKPLLEKGYDQALREDAVNNKDMGIEDFHAALYGDNTNAKLVKDIADMNLMPESFMRKLNSPMPKNTGKIPTFVKESEYVDKLSNKLMKISATDDLILLRGAALDANATEGEFSQALQKAVGQGLKLSPFQSNQLSELQIPREPSVWDFFGTAGWKKRFNLERGKK